MEFLKKKWVKSAICLALFTLFSVSLVITVQATIYEKYVRNNQRSHLQNQLALMLPDIRYNNNLIKSCGLYQDPQITNNEKYRIYTASFNNEVTGYIIQHMTNHGYSGEIVMLTSITPKGDIIKVSVMKHNETPGLGDIILQKSGQWLDQFIGANLSNRKYAVTKDGGDFTYTTGATITPRAVVNAEKDLLEYFLNHKRKFNLQGSCDGE
jgi:electron transport complex protein RnfG